MFCARSVNVYVPADSVLIVPESTPVLVLNESPGGSVPVGASHVELFGLAFVSVNVVEYAEPSVPTGGVPVIVGAVCAAQFAVAVTLLLGIVKLTALFVELLTPDTEGLVVQLMKLCPTL